MTKLVILSPEERHQFDSPPQFNPKERSHYFSISDDLKIAIKNLHTNTNKVGFLLQLGYFRASGKFFTIDNFCDEDIDYVIQCLEFENDNIDLEKYRRKTPTYHRNKILTFLAWRPFEQEEENRLKIYIKWHIKRQLPPRQVFFSAAEFCWKNKTEVPSYNSLTKILTNSYNSYEASILKIVKDNITSKDILLLDDFMHGGKESRMNRPPITLFRNINQSSRPSDINDNVNIFCIYKDFYFKLNSIMSKLSLSEPASKYFSTWVQKAETFQLNQFPNKNKAYLYLLAFIKYHFYSRHDALVEIYLKAVQSSINAARKQRSQMDINSRGERNKAIKKVTKASKDARKLIDEIDNIINIPALNDHEQLIRIKKLVKRYHISHDKGEEQNIDELEDTLADEIKNRAYFDALDSVSLKLQRRVSAILRSLEFNAESPCTALVIAITHFKTNDGKVGSNAPTKFLSTDELGAISRDGFRISLYKILLFIHVADAIKSGNLNLSYSHRYRAIHEYLIKSTTWNDQRKELLIAAGLNKFSDSKSTLRSLKDKLESKYKSVNQNYNDGINKHLTIDGGKAKLVTPKIENNDNEYISSLLTQNCFVPILEVLSDINNKVGFVDCFKHHSIKHKKLKPDVETIFAGLLGKGCNIGINRIANISIGISEKTLQNTVNWCFSLANIQAANNKIIGLIDKLALANAYRYDQTKLHSSSDGRKVNVSVDSLHASYSYKYFGKGKGVTMYTFIDERQLLFHSTVISSSEREATYVIDGLQKNEVIKSNIHSTDTHGFTEAVFAGTHLIDTSFAPRLKNIGSQTIYAFSDKNVYLKRGYKILPSRRINQRLIEENWDDILRFMATIKLGETSASQLFKRLSSYAKEHPLYKALKEFGRIIKSDFILTYFDELELRQRIEKQLNRVELSNRFSKAVFFANNQEFKVGGRDEQEVDTACKILIQNVIVLWNYLYFSQYLINTPTDQERTEIIESVSKGSMMTWRHVNLHGEYDFTKKAKNDQRFNLPKILKLVVPPN